MSNRPVSVIGFDADDTLWHHERFFQLTTDKFVGLLKPFVEGPHLVEHLHAAVPEEQRAGDGDHDLPRHLDAARPPPHEELGARLQRVRQCPFDEFAAEAAALGRRRNASGRAARG